MADNFLEKIDFTLRKIVNAKNGANKLNVNLDEAFYLEQEGFIKSNEDKFMPTVKGKIFVSNGGFIGEAKRKKRARHFRNGFWIANMLNLILSMFLYVNSFPVWNDANIPYNVDSTLFIIDQKCDTSIYRVNYENISK